ncbi:hypothetical protein ACYOEI_08375 [Singulisphaera rosea]
MTIPSPASAKAALIASLEAWKSNDRRSGIVIGGKPPIGVVDSTRPERRLVDYEIVGALMSSEKARPFAVRLTLDEPRETVMTRYLVIGREPLWVFLQEDFDRMLHWEHKMDDEATADPDRPTGGASNRD